MIIRGIFLIFLIMVCMSSYIPWIYFVNLHEFPPHTKEDFDPYFLILFYLKTINESVYLGKYEFSPLINQLTFMSIPPDLKFVVYRINEKIVNLNMQIKNAKYYVEQAEFYIHYRMYENALKEVGKARYWLASANITVNELIDAFTQLSPFLRKYSEFNEKVREVIEHLKLLFERINELINYLTHQINEIEEVAKEILDLWNGGGFIDTYLTIYSNVSEVWVGGELTIYGRLYSYIESLVNKTVFVVVNEKKYIVFTDYKGRYHVDVEIPFVYRDSLTVYVFYVPDGDDAEIYIPSFNKTTLKLLFYRTDVDLSVDYISYPGLTLNISLDLSPWEDGLTRNVSLFFDNRLVGTYTVNSSRFTISYYLPPNTSIGVHTVGVYVSPYREYSPSSAISITRIRYQNVFIRLDISPDIPIYPLSQLNIGGYVVDELNRSIGNTSIAVYIGDEVYNVSTDMDGRFNLTVDPPFTPLYLNIRLTIDPKEPWYAASTSSYTIIVLNLYVIGIFAILTVILGYVTVKLIKRRREPISIPMEEPSKPIQSEPGEATLMPIIRKYREFGGEIYRYYSGAVDLLSPVVGAPKEFETLREYYFRIQKSLNGVSESLWRLTLLAEYELYSGRPVTMDKVREARKLYEMIKRNVVKKS